MSAHLEKLGVAPRDGPVVVIILDGFGVDKPGPGNAVVQADMKYYNSLVAEAKERHLYALIKAHGPAVGLPTDGDMGNSEVGHNALGCGQVYSQGTKLVNESLASGAFFKTKNWDETVGAVARSGKALHFFGLWSDGNVHSHVDQVFKMIDGAIATGVKHIRVHPLLDGRDVAPDSGLKYIARLEEKLAEVRKAGIDAVIASGGGRMTVTMDRYESDWSIVKRGWDAMVRGIVTETEITAEYPGYFKSATEAIECARRVFPKKLDQFNPPFVVVGEDGKPLGRMVDGDGVINFNFRGDRAIQISKAFDQDNFTAFDRVERPKVHYAGLMEYDTEWHIPRTFLVPPPSIQHISSQYLVDAGVTSYALAETHKFGHMTFFWNGNRSGYLNRDLELYEEVTSLPNEETEGHPEMKAREVTDKLLAALATKKYKYLRVNYANPDMVGHTGNIKACIEALHVIDGILAEVIPAIAAQKGLALILADHGNIEQMIDKTGAVMTSHTTNPVNFIIVDTSYKGDYVVDTTGIAQPGLTNVTATFMNLLGFKEPSMYARGLVKFTK
eukprot:m51a1_g1683 putative -bisphosphoglycerate-independent phosphoglycerate mutase (557) ;mRNA; r:438447-440699